MANDSKEFCPPRTFNDKSQVGPILNYTVYVARSASILNFSCGKLQCSRVCKLLITWQLTCTDYTSRVTIRNVISGFKYCITDQLYLKTETLVDNDKQNRQTISVDHIVWSIVIIMELVETRWSVTQEAPHPALQCTVSLYLLYNTWYTRDANCGVTWYLQPQQRASSKTLYYRTTQRSKQIK